MRGSDDGLRIYGGAGLSRVDAVAVREAAAHMDRAVAALEGARFRLARAVLEIEGLAFAQGATLTSSQQPESAGGAPMCYPGPDLRYRHVIEDIEGVARSLAVDVADCATVRDRLLRAAGLYEDSESSVENVAGFLIRVEAARIGHIVSATPILSAVLAYAVWKSQAEGGQGDAAHGESGASSPGTVDEAREQLAAAGAPAKLWAHMRSTWSDEMAAGLAFGISSGQPFLARGDFSVTGAAQVLSINLARWLPTTTALVREVEVDALTPAGEHAPTGTILASFAKVEGLYGRRMDGTPIDVPPGTIAVERVERADGTASWVVIIPGTQAALSKTNPFDGKSDIEAMAFEAVQVADSTVAVEAALAEAGVPPDEPVTLIGHSLGGITALALTGSPAFRDRYTVGGVVTAGSPVAPGTIPPGIPVLRVEHEQDVVPALDGHSSAENPRSADQITVSRDLMMSPDPRDRVAALSVVGSHVMPPYARTLKAGVASGNEDLIALVEEIESLMTGTSAQTQYYQAERVEAPADQDREPAREPAPSPGPAPVDPDWRPFVNPLAEQVMPPFEPTTVAPFSDASSGRGVR